MYNLFAKANKKRAKRRGFTLIELIIVIVILGILAGVAAISFSDVTQSSKAGVAKANLRAIKSACQVFQIDNNGKFPKNIDKDSFQKYLDQPLKDAINDTSNLYKYKLAATGTGAAAKIVLTVEGPGIEANDKAAKYEMAGESVDNQ